MIDLTFQKTSKLIRKIAFDKGQKVSVKNFRCECESVHTHDCTEVIYVIHGDITVKMSIHEYVLHENDFIIINDFDIHAIKAANGDAVISSVYINHDEFFCINSMIIWNMNTLKRNQDVYEKLRQKVRELIVLNCTDVTFSKMNDLASDIVNELYETMTVESFFAGNFGSTEPGQYEQERIKNIFDYLYSHFDEKITLEVLSKEIAVSKYYLSHYMRKMTGTNFQSCMKQIRCEMAEIFLLETEETINNIEEMCGFSSAQYFNACIKEIFGCSPSEYRHIYKTRKGDYVLNQEKEITDIRPWITEQESAAGAELVIKLPDNYFKIVIVREDSQVETVDINSSGNKILTVDSSATIIVQKQ